LFENIFPSTVRHCVDLYVQLQLDATPTIMAIFYLWMSEGQQDTFAFVVNFLSTYCHVTIDLFEANAITGVGLARQLKAMLEKFGPHLRCCEEGTNLSSMTTTLKLMISCEALNLLQPFDETCFGHVMNKVAHMQPMIIKFPRTWHRLV
jgi:hypothetical protein